MDAILLVLLTVGGVVLLALLGAQVGERRTKLLRQAADDMGFAFRPNDPGLAAALSGLTLFGQGQASHARNVVHGAAVNPEVLVCDLHYIHAYSVGTSRQERHLRASVLTFLDREASWPSFCLRPRRFYQLRPGQTEVRFGEEDAFAKTYVLTGDDESAVRELFNDGVRHYFAQNPGLGAEAAGPRLVFSTGRLIAPEELRPFLEQGFRVMNELLSDRPRL